MASSQSVNYPITATAPHGAGVGNVVLPGVGIDNLLRALRARECLCQPREAHHSPTSVGRRWVGFRVYFSLGLSSVMLLCWEYGHQTFSMHGYVGDGFRRGLMKKLVNCWPRRTHVVTMGGLWVNFSLGLSSVMLLWWEYGHQTFSMHEYVEDGFRRSFMKKLANRGPLEHVGGRLSYD
ncbi:unnamed protein product [Prunus armeniaca]